MHESEATNTRNSFQRSLSFSVKRTGLKKWKPTLLKILKGIARTVSSCCGIEKFFLKAMSFYQK